MMLECIATRLEDAKRIAENGGDRIELVSGLGGGGFTPSDGLVRAVHSAVNIPIAVMLRPNLQGFHYSEDDLQEMRRDALRFHELGVKRIVTGILDADGIADIDAIERVIAGTDYKVTFHRAIDETTDVAASLDRINLCARITHILTSLGPGTAHENLAKLAWYAENSRPRLILGSGVNHANIEAMAAMARSYQCDLHVGTALRGGEVMTPVQAEALRQIVAKLEPFRTRQDAD